jgi:hypothetical protein
MDLRLELRRTTKLVVASPKGDLVSVGFLSRHSRAGLWILPSLPGLVCGKDLWSGCGAPVPGSGFFRPFRGWFSEKICGRGVASPKGDLVSVGFLSRHSRAGLWILPSLPGLVRGKDLWSDGTGTLLEAVNERPTLQVRGAVQTVAWHTGQGRQNGCKVRQLRKEPCVFAGLR